MSLKNKLLTKSLKGIGSKRKGGNYAPREDTQLLTTNLRNTLATYKQLQQLLSDNTLLQRTTHKIQAWQKKRVHFTYEALIKDTRLTDAVHFLLEEAYAGPDQALIWRDIERVLPQLIDVFPVGLLNIANDMLRLHTISLSLDIDLALRIIADSPVSAPTDSPDQIDLSPKLYEMAYAHDQLACSRQIQLDLVQSLGSKVITFLSYQWIPTVFKATKLPARALGLGALVDFMQRGLDLFYKLPIPADELINQIVIKERDYLNRLIQGDRGVFAFA